MLKNYSQDLVEESDKCSDKDEQILNCLKVIKF